MNDKERKERVLAFALNTTLINVKPRQWQEVVKSETEIFTTSVFARQLIVLYQFFQKNSKQFAIVSKKLYRHFLVALLSFQPAVNKKRLLIILLSRFWIIGQSKVFQREQISYFF